MLVGSVAIKVPRLKHWGEALACSREAERWQSLGDDRLCRVRRRCLRGVLLVMDRADAVGVAELERRDELGENDRLLEYRVRTRPSLCAEPNGRNIGKLPDSRLVVIDFGDEESASAEMIDAVLKKLGAADPEEP